MRSSPELGALALSAVLLAGCEGDACHEEEVALHDLAALSAGLAEDLAARCDRGDARDRCPIDDCDALCPLYTVAGGTTVSVEPSACRLDAAAARLSCDYRVLYDVCG